MITWEQFITSNNDVRGVRYKFEDLSRQLFIYEFLSNNNNHKYVHSNPNNPGIESEPILDEVNNKYIGYQAKFFEVNVDYAQIKESAQKAIKHYSGKLDRIYLFCNKPITTTCESYKEIEKMLNDVNIDLELITDTTILDLVRKYPILGEYYFNDHNISHKWFVQRASVISDILGERFNTDFNVDTEASKYLSIFLQDQKALDYYNTKKIFLIEKIKSLKWKLGDLYKYACGLAEFIIGLPDLTYDDLGKVVEWHGLITEHFKDTLKEIEIKIYDNREEYEKIKDTDKRKKVELESNLQKLYELKELFFHFEIPDIEQKLLLKKILIVDGQAGIGKTQLFANETKSLLDLGRNALMIIGSDCLSNGNIFEQLQSNLRLDFKFEKLIDILDIIGEKNGEIVPILIDALNESWYPRLWKNVLPILNKKISEKQYVRLAISFRTEYQNLILPDGFLCEDNVVKIRHNGFKENSIEATRKFLSYYGIPFSPLYMLNSNIENPLFLTLYCKTYRGDEVRLPELYERLLETANDKLHMKLKKAIETAGYEPMDNIVQPIIEAISKETLSTGKRYFEKSELESLSVWQSLGLRPRPFITQLVKENILHDYEYNDKTYVYFSFDQMNDYFSAKTVFSMLQTEGEIRQYVKENVLCVSDGKIKNFEKESLFIHICALYAEKFGKECIDIIDLINDKYDKMNLFKAYIESFEWRDKINMSLDELLESCNNLGLNPSILWNAFINNSTKDEHLLNADNLNKVLKGYSIAQRDYFWTIFINDKYSDENRLVQLINIFNSGEEFIISTDKQIRLLLILFSWILTSSNRKLRDITSKAMIEILKNHFKYAEYLLKLFSDVNDPYVIQRLYGIAFGACVKRNEENKDIFKSLTCFVFEEIFDKDIIYPDILLRDYARLIIERYMFEYPNDFLDYELNKIKPQYKSIPIPDIEDQKYLEKNFEGGMFLLQCSMRFEGMGVYGDFGRYVFQRAVKNFDVDNYKVFNYALYYILNELGYDEELFGEYDSYTDKFILDRHSTIKIERIGKKYQWIAMYNILARISDYSPMKNCYSMENEIISYDGPWEPYVRDFDPTLNEYNLVCDEAPYFQKVDDHIEKVVKENKHIVNDTKFNEDEWIASHTTFFEYQKEDLLLTDSNKNQWIVLSKRVNTGIDTVVNKWLRECNGLYGYFVSDEQLAMLKEYANKEINLFNNDIDIMEVPKTYATYNREYPWSSGSKSLIENQWKKIEIRTCEKKQVSITVEVPQLFEYDGFLDEYIEQENTDEDSKSNVDFSESLKLPTVNKEFIREEPITIDLGLALNTTQELLWEEEFDASQEEAILLSHPCSEIINTLKLYQMKCDGYYYDENRELIAFDTDLTNQNAGLIIRKEALDKFLCIKKLHLVWLINASKEIHDKSLNIIKYKDWTGVLEYTNDSIQGSYYIAKF